MLGISSIIDDLIKNETVCDVTILENDEFNTLNGCKIIKQDGVMVQFEYPSNGKTYIYSLGDIWQIRFDTVT